MEVKIEDKNNIMATDIESILAENEQLRNENANLKRQLTYLQTCECLEGNQDCMCCPEHKDNWRSGFC